MKSILKILLHREANKQRKKHFKRKFYDAMRDISRSTVESRFQININFHKIVIRRFLMLCFTREVIKDQCTRIDIRNHSHRQHASTEWNSENFINFSALSNIFIFSSITRLNPQVQFPLKTHIYCFRNCQNLSRDEVKKAVKHERWWKYILFMGTIIKWRFIMMSPPTHFLCTYRTSAQPSRRFQFH